MIVRKKRFVAGLVVLLTFVAALFVWAAVAGELRDRNIDGDGLDPNQTITSALLGYDRYSVCDLKAEGTEDGYSGTYWDCWSHGDVFFPEGQWPLRDGLHEEEVPGGWVHVWMEIIVILIGVAIGAVLMVSSTKDVPPPSSPSRKRA